MQHLMIVGGGFAGVWAALSAAGEARQRLRITLVVPEPYLINRPRLYEANPETFRTPLLPPAILRIT